MNVVPVVFFAELLGAQMTAGTTARKVARSDGFKGLAKLGFAARGTIYLLIGWFAVLLALGKTRRRRTSGARCRRSPGTTAASCCSG